MYFFQFDHSQVGRQLLGNMLIDGLLNFDIFDTLLFVLRVPSECRMKVACEVGALVHHFSNATASEYF